MNRLKDDWYEFPVNLVVGCQRKCPRCEAMRMAHNFSGDVTRNISEGKYRKEGDLYVLDEPIKTERGNFDSYPFEFSPTFHRYRYKSLDEHKNGNMLFTSAFGDMFEDWMPDEYIREIFEECKERPRHNYMFMTKNPERYNSFYLPGGKNFWYGTSISENVDLGRLDHLPASRNTFVAIEPVRSPLFIPIEDMMCVNWVILGAEVGRHTKEEPNLAGIFEIVNLCDTLEIPVFMRPSLLPIVGEENMRREKPKQLLRKVKSKKLQILREDECIRCRARHDKKEMATVEARRGRGGKRRNICFICRECYKTWCDEWGMTDYSDVFFKEEKDEKKKLQTDG